MNIPAYEVKFQTGYRLLQPTKDTAMATRGKREYTLQAAPFPRGRSGSSPQRLKNLEACYTLMKVYIAQETSNGETFLQPLSEIKDVLEQVVLALSSGEEGINKSQVTTYIHTIYHLITKKLISYMPKIKQSKQEMGELLLDVLCYVNALDEESRATFPEAFASCLLYFLPSPDWKGACDEIMSRLCRYVLPTSLADAQTHHYNGMCTSSALMMVLEGSDAPQQHLLIADTLMQLKRNVCSDIMSVIAFGTSTIRHKALKLLLHYWPIPIRDFSSHALTTSRELSSPNCENTSCPSPSNNRATILCLDALCAAQHKEHGTTKLWMMLCADCHQAMHGSSSQGSDHLTVPIPVPLYTVKETCEFQTCSGRDRPAEVTCYDVSCCMSAQRHSGSGQSKHPIRMCVDCHKKQHRDVNDPKHIFQVGPPDPWSTDNLASGSMMLETVSKLLEIVPVKKVREVQQANRLTVPRGSTPHHVTFRSNALLDVDISREGMWFLSHYCTPTTSVRENQQDWLVHLVALVLEWLQSYNDILREEEEQLLQLASDGSDSLEHLDSAIPDYSSLFSNFTDISTLINSYTLPWFRSVCSSNSECVSEALKPDTPPCAQIGKLWNKSYSSVDRHKRTLSVIHSLFLLYHDGKLQEKIFKKIFNSVISLWMDVLFSMRSEPGHMDKLQDQFKQIFFYEIHVEGLMLFSFMLDVFRNNDPDEQQRALFWLQDLTRLGVSVPFLPHMCEDALTDKHHKSLHSRRQTATQTSTSSFDQEAEEVRSKPHKRDSSTSLSGYESESALVSQSSIEQGDTQMIVSLNSSLTRFILMLDTWLSQLLELNTSTLNYSDLQKSLVLMLRKFWGSNHTFQDHRETSNLCLLCRGMSLWFNLATKLVTEYSRREKEAIAAGEDGTDFQDLSSPVDKQKPRPSLRQVIITPLNMRRRKFMSAADPPPEYHRAPYKNSPQMKKLSQGSILDAIEAEGYSSGASPLPVRKSGGGGVDLPNQSPREIRAKGLQRIRPRRLAQVQSHSEFEVVSNLEQVPPAKQGEGHDEETTPNLYIIFQLCIDKLSVKLHPDTLLHIVKFLTLLMRNCQVLDLANEPEDAVKDCKDLFERLWKCLETETSHAARSCVGLLFDCVQFLAINVPRPPSTDQPHPSAAGTTKDHLSLSTRHVGFESDVEECSNGSGQTDVSELERGLMWKTIKENLTASSWSNRFKAVEKMTMVLQFMRSKDVMDLTYHQFHPSVQFTLAYGFCLLTQLIQDKNSNVCVRAKYCLSSISGSALEALKDFLRQLFMEYSKYRTMVLQTLGLLDSKLPELNFMDAGYITHLLRFATLQVGGLQIEREVPPATNKKVSDVSVVSGGGFFRGTPKVSTASTAPPIGGLLEDDPTVVALVQRVLSLLLRHLSRQHNDLKEPVKKSSAHRSTKRPSNLTYRAIARVTSFDPMEILVETLAKQVFKELRCLPQELRNYKIYAVFLNHIYPVLDHNVEFGQTKGLLPFLLKLLGYSAAPNQTDFPHLTLDDRQVTRESTWKECGYNLSFLPPKIQAPWLRVFFVILYKYIHNYSETEPGAQGHIVLLLTRWCLEITLKTLETEPHTCQFISLSDVKKHRPALKRQTTLSTFVSSVASDSVSGEIPSVNVTEGSPNTPVKLFQFQSTREVVALSPVPEAVEESGTQLREEGCAQTGKGTKGRRSTSLNVRSSTLESTTEQPNKEGAVASPPTPGLCMTCNKPTDEYTEEVIALASLAVGTCCHRMPHTVSGYLVSRVVPSIAKVIVPGSYSWQTVTDKSEPPPGSAMAVAKHLLSSILTQFADRRLFLYLFAHDYGKMADTVFQGMAISLADADGDVPSDQGGEKSAEDRLYQFSAIKYFLSDAVSSQHFTQDVRHFSLINLAKYMEILQEQAPPTSPGTASTVSLTRDLALWDGFCKKLKNHNDLLRHTKAVQSFLRIIIFLLQNTADSSPQHSLASYHAHTIQSFMASLASVVEPSLRFVYCPLGGLVKLASLWYKVFQQHLHRDSERFVKLYIGELRKALKARNNIGESVRADNFLSLIQVLLLEEDGYLGYVDGLTHTRHFAPDLKRAYETYSLHVIEQMQWDFLDALNFLKTPNLKWPSEMIPQLKLTLAQLIALRVQHGRSPQDILKRLVNESDTRAISASNPRSAGGHTVQPRWRDYLSALQLLSWLMLGAMCHNAINTVALEMRVEGYTNYSSGKCQLLGSLNTKMEAVTSGVIELTLGALKKSTLSNNEDNYFGYLYLTLIFSSIWTVYMELYVDNSAPHITEFWQKFIGRLTQLLYSKSLDDLYRKEVILTLNEYVVVKMKEIGLSSYSLLVPIWREVTNTVSDSSLVFPDLPSPMATVATDLWFKDTVKELVLIEQEWQTNVSSNAAPS